MIITLRRLFCVICCFVLIYGNLHSQYIIKGTIKDANEGFSIPFARIVCSCNKEVFFSDENGNFLINLTKDSCLVEFSSTAYHSLKRAILFNSRQKELKIDIKLEPEAQILDAADVVSTKYETEPAKSTSSMMVLDTKKADSKNITTVDALINTAGGVAVVDNEPQIRGGSGFSSGMGSRVMILLDDIPMLRPDAGRPMWNFIPMEDVEQVQILKGAASVVFGSSALTGAINVLTAYPRSKPKTKVSVFTGFYSKPKNKSFTSWNHQNPIKYGVNFLHSRIIKNNFDFVIGGEYFGDQGYIGPEESLLTTRNTDGTTRGKYEQRGRLNFATRFRFNKCKGLSVSLNGNAMYSENAQSFFWYDGNENRYRTYKGSLSHFKDFTFYVDPTAKYVSPHGFVHTFRNRITYSNNAEATGAQSAQSLMVFDEYQLNKNIKKIGLNIVGGLMNMYAQSFGPVFNGDNYSLQPKRMISDNFSIYAQLEQKFLKNRNLTVQLGGRWEFYKLAYEVENKPVFRAGINYQFLKSKTSLRASFGQGYRYPSIGEKFIAISVGNYGFYPNENLKSEYSWNAEVGAMQPFMFFDFKGMFDVAVYNQYFDNYIEFAMGPWGTSSNPIDNLGFTFLNTGPANISGVDFSVMGEGKISKNVSYTLSLSYTYSHPITLNKEKVYYSHNGVDYSFNSSASDTTRSVLKYRIEHIARLDLEFFFYKKIKVGLAINYLSSMRNVDKVFYDLDIENPTLSDYYVATFLQGIVDSQGDLPFTGFYNFSNSSHNKNGNIVFDARISYDFKNLTLAFIVKNLFNREYTLRPMYLEAPRTFTIQFNYHIN